jgi:hypothetical protein
VLECNPVPTPMKHNLHKLVLTKVLRSADPCAANKDL